MDRLRFVTPKIAHNAAELALRLNELFADPSMSKFDVEMTSGFRDPTSNKAAGGATRSAHLEGMAVDIRDPKGRMAAAVEPLLERYDLYRENPKKTKGWLHLQSRVAGNRTFDP